MHELSIVMGIIEIAEKEAAKAHLSSFDSIELDIGQLSGIVLDALDFAWEIAVKDTVLANAERQINYINAQSKCLDCNTEFDSESLFEACPNCASYTTTLIKGNELKVKSLTSNT